MCIRDSLNYPKDKDLLWQIKKPSEEKYTKTTQIPFDLSREFVYNKQQNKSTLEDFFT